MAIVNINTIKEWFSNQKKPPQEQFWAWLDSFYHKWEGIAISGITGLVEALQKKADLVNGVVPESQLPFSVQTSEIIAIGDITTSTNDVNLAVHSSGSNKVRIKGKIYERAFPNTFSYAAVVNYIKILILYALPDSSLFYLAEGLEAEAALDPDLPPGAVPIKKITVNLTSQVVEDYSDLFKSIDDRLNSLQINLDNEETERLDQIAQEIENRLATETNLGNSITAEATARATQDGVISARIDGKLDKPLPPDNVNTNVILGSGSTKNLSDFQVNKQYFVTLPATVSEDWKGCIVFFTNTGTLTVPNNLSADFTLNGVVDLGLTLSFAITSPMAWLGTAPTSVTGNAIFTLLRRDGTNNFQILGI